MKRFRNGRSRLGVRVMNALAALCTRVASWSEERAREWKRCSLCGEVYWDGPSGAECRESIDAKRARLRTYPR